LDISFFAETALPDDGRIEERDVASEIECRARAKSDGDAVTTVTGRGTRNITGLPPRSPRRRRFRPVRIRSWQQATTSRASIRGCMTIELANDMVVHDVRLMTDDKNDYWIALPPISRITATGWPRLDAGGEPVFTPAIEFRNPVARERFSRQVLDALRRDFPEAFDDPLDSAVDEYLEAALRKWSRNDDDKND
jgi:hypothetical protein